MAEQVGGGVAGDGGIPQVGQSAAAPEAEAHGRRGLELFMQEQYVEAEKDLNTASQLDARWADLHARAASNAFTRYDLGLRTIPFSKSALLAPPAFALRTPLDLAPMPPGPGVVRRLVASVTKIAGLTLGRPFSLLVRVLGGKGQEDSWRKWPTRQTFLLRDFGLAAIRNYMNHNTLQDQDAGRLVGNQQPGQRRPTWTERYRTATGAWNTDNPMEGAAGARFIWQAKELGPRRDTVLDSPNPIEVANVILRSGEKRETVPFLNLLAVGWIQFMVHDWFNHRQTAQGEIRVPFPDDDPRRRKYGRDYMTFRRTQPSIRDGNSFAFENEVTAWWDGSQIYGSDQFTQDRLRACNVATWIRLLEADHAARDPKPQQPPVPATYDPAVDLASQGKLFVEDNQPPEDSTTGLIDSGFTRNMWVGLELFHTLFIRHHNWLCDRYAEEHPDWSSDQIFHHARLENAATMAKIHTIEWTPAVLPTKELSFGMNANWHGMVETIRRPFEDRKPLRTLQPIHPLLGGIVGGELDNFGVPQNFSEQFAEVYRLHPALPDVIEVRPIGDPNVEFTVPTERTRAAGSRKMIKALNQRFGKQGLATLINSFGCQHMPSLVNNNYPKFMTDMSVEGAPMFDMAAADIVRARERGVPRFNEFRRQLGMPAITSFTELKTDAETLEKLRKLYRYEGETDDSHAIERLDLAVGMLCDRNRPLKGFDNTRFAIFLQAATRRLQTDPFFTEKYNERYYTKAGLARVDRVTLKELLLWHFPELQKSGLMGVHNAFEPWGTTAETAPEEHPLAAIERYRYTPRRLS